MADGKLNGIYKISCKSNGKIYIGESGDIIKRWGKHLENLLSGSHHSYKLQEDFLMYGLYDFTFEIVNLLPDQNMGFYKSSMHRIYRENHYIKKFDAINHGYNIKNTYEDIISGKDYKISQKDRYYLMKLEKNEEIFIEDDCEPITNLDDSNIQKEGGKLKKTKKIRNANNINIINETDNKLLGIQDMKGVYCIKNIKNGKELVLHSDKILSSINRIVNKLNKGEYYNREIQNDWIEYTCSCFEYRLLEDTYEYDESYKEFIRLKYSVKSEHSYNTPTYREKIEYEWLKKIDDKGLRFKRKYAHKTDDDYIVFDIAVLKNGELQGFIMLDYCTNPLLDEESIVRYKILIESKIKYCKDSNIVCKVVKIV